MNNYYLKRYCPMGRNYGKSKQVKKSGQIATFEEFPSGTQTSRKPTFVGGVNG